MLLRHLCASRRIRGWKRRPTSEQDKVKIEPNHHSHHQYHYPNILSFVFARLMLALQRDKRAISDILKPVERMYDASLRPDESKTPLRNVAREEKGVSVTENEAFTFGNGQPHLKFRTRNCHFSVLPWHLHQRFGSEFRFAATRWFASHQNSNSDFLKNHSRHEFLPCARRCSLCALSSIDA